MQIKLHHLTPKFYRLIENEKFNENEINPPEKKHAILSLKKIKSFYSNFQPLLIRKMLGQARNLRGYGGLQGLLAKAQVPQGSQAQPALSLRIGNCFGDTVLVATVRLISQVQSGISNK